MALNKATKLSSLQLDNATDLTTGEMASVTGGILGIKLAGAAVAGAVGVAGLLGLGLLKIKLLFGAFGHHSHGPSCGC